jgi:hypothetical protein
MNEPLLLSMFLLFILFIPIPPLNSHLYKAPVHQSLSRREISLHWFYRFLFSIPIATMWGKPFFINALALINIEALPPYGIVPELTLLFLVFQVFILNTICSAEIKRIKMQNNINNIILDLEDRELNHGFFAVLITRTIPMIIVLTIISYLPSVFAQQILINESGFGKFLIGFTGWIIGKKIFLITIYPYFMPSYVNKQGLINKIKRDKKYRNIEDEEIDNL